MIFFRSKDSKPHCGTKLLFTITKMYTYNNVGITNLFKTVLWEVLKAKYIKYSHVHSVLPENVKSHYR